MKKYYVLAVLIIVIISCQKKTTSNDLYIRGRLFLTDTVSQHIQSKPLAKTTIFISDADPAVNPNFLQSVVSDDDGYFVFSLDPKSERNYYVSAEFVNQDLHFKSLKHITDSNNIAIQLRFDETSQNGLSIRLKDQNNSPFANQSVNIYQNLVIAQSDDTLGTNAYKKLISDDYGRITLFNIQQGKYYLKARKRIGATVLVRNLKEVDIPKTGLLRDTMLIK